MSERQKPALRELIEAIVYSLVDELEEVDIHFVEGQNTRIVEIRTSQTDTGKVIGRNGRTADAIRTIVGNACAQDAKRVVLQIID